MTKTHPIPQTTTEALRSLAEDLPNAVPVEQQEERTRWSDACDSTKTFKEIIDLLADLDEPRTAMLIQIARLMQHGDKHLCSDDNWAERAVGIIARTCAEFGPARTLEAGPGELIEQVADAYSGFLRSIDEIAQATKTYSRSIQCAVRQLD